MSAGRKALTFADLKAIGADDPIPVELPGGRGVVYLGPATAGLMTRLAQKGISLAPDAETDEPDPLMALQAMPYVIQNRLVDENGLRILKTVAQAEELLDTWPHEVLNAITEAAGTMDADEPESHAETVGKSQDPPPSDSSSE